MFVYIEYYSRRPGVPLKHFHQIAGSGQNGWSAEHGQDALVMNVGKTWRLGPDPEYFAVWANEVAGLGRISEWEDVFRSGAAEAFELPFEVVARIERAACYVARHPLKRATGGPYYVEWFNRPAGVSEDDVEVTFADRAASVDAELVLLCHRIGLLAPTDGFAAWQLNDYAALELVVPDAALRSRIAFVDAGVYADMGEEVL